MCFYKYIELEFLMPVNTEPPVSDHRRPHVHYILGCHLVLGLVPAGTDLAVKIRMQNMEILAPTWNRLGYRPHQRHRPPPRRILIAIPHMTGALKHINGDV